MTEWLKRSFLGLLICALALGGCGGDDDTATGPVDDGTDEVTPEAAFLAGALLQSLQEAFFASLIADPTSVNGVEGTLDISGNIWTFRGYSPDGDLFINGELTVEKDQFPTIPASGQLMLSGSEEGNLTIDMVVTVQGVEFAATGTIRLDDQVWDVADLIASSEGGD